MKVSTVVFLNGQAGGPSVQVVSLLRMAHDAVNMQDLELAKTAYTRAIFVARTTDDFIGIVQHAGARNFHQSAKDALFAAKGHTQDVNLLLRLANIGAQAGYIPQTTDIYQSAIAASSNFYQLNVIAQHAEHNHYPETARQARLKAISLA
ncbi:MAG: hypothetical protein H7338_02250 [Candidatus Sericytochromatia bacterium]|nr:hypothetical protein [Candidatus Sericytochromatia bacterium]